MIKIQNAKPMTKKRICLNGRFYIELHIDNRHATIPFNGKNSYGLCGAQIVKVGLIDEETGEIDGYIFQGGYMNRIMFVGKDSDDSPYLFIEVEYFVKNHLLPYSKSFSCEKVALL